MFHKHFTHNTVYDTLSKKNKTWKEINMSTLNFCSNTSQTCYIAVNQLNVDVILGNKNRIPVDTIAYEYICNVKKNNDEEILAVDLDTAQGMLDLTNKTDYINYLNGKINKKSTTKDILLMRGVKIEPSINHMFIYFIIKNAKCIKDVRRIL